MTPPITYYDYDHPPGKRRARNQKEIRDMSVAILVKNTEPPGGAAVEVLRNAPDPLDCELLATLQPGEDFEVAVWRGTSFTVKEKM